MKKTSKLLLTLLSISLVVTACGPTDAPKNKTVESITNSKLDNKEIVDKTLNAFANIKSFEAKGSEESYFSDETQPVPQEYSYDVDNIVIFNPEYANKKTLTSNTGKIQHFIEKDGIYYRYYYPKNIHSGSWAKGDIPSSFIESRIANIKKLDLLNEMLIYKEGFSVVETNEGYEITFKPNDLQKWKTVYLKEDTGIDLEKSTIKNFEFKLLVNKENFLPIEKELEYTIIRHNSKTNSRLTSYLKEDITFNNYNSARDFQVPSEAINASGRINIG